MAPVELLVHDPGAQALEPALLRRHLAPPLEPRHRLREGVDQDPAGGRSGAGAGCRVVLAVGPEAVLDPGVEPLDEDVPHLARLVVARVEGQLEDGLALAGREEDQAHLGRVPGEDREVHPVPPGGGAVGQRVPPPDPEVSPDDAEEALARGLRGLAHPGECNAWPPAAFAVSPARSGGRPTRPREGVMATWERLSDAPLVAVAAGVGPWGRAAGRWPGPCRRRGRLAAQLPVSEPEPARPGLRGRLHADQRPPGNRADPGARRSSTTTSPCRTAGGSTSPWTGPIASSLMGFYLVPANTCTVDEFNARSCNFVVRSEPVERQAAQDLARRTSPPGNYRWIVAQLRAEQESVVVPDRAVRRARAAAAGRWRPPSAAVRRTSTLPALERAPAAR